MFTRRVLLCKFTHTFTFSCCWNFRASHNILRWTRRRSRWWWNRIPRRWTKDNEWYIIRCVTIEVLAIFDEMWCLTDGPRVTTPKFLAESQANEPPVYLEEALPSRTVVGFFDILTVSNSALWKSFLQTMCLLAPESITNYLSSFVIVDAAGKTHSSLSE